VDLGTYRVSNRSPIVWSYGICHLRNLLSVVTDTQILNYYSVNS
jgi:hypothetical protein